MSFVYLLRSKGYNFCKIGMADDVEKRVAQLSVPFELEILATLQTLSRESAVFVESKLHEFFKPRHIRGEWFSNVNSREWRKAGREFISDLVDMQDHVGITI